MNYPMVDPNEFPDDWPSWLRRLAQADFVVADAVTPDLEAVIQAGAIDQIVQLASYVRRIRAR